jgi:excisionase family DNA binding protein
MPLATTSPLARVHFLTVDEVAKWATISTKTVYRWIAAGKLTAVRFGDRTYRIPEQAVIDLLKEQGLADYLLSPHPTYSEYMD